MASAEDESLIADGGYPEDHFWKNMSCRTLAGFIGPGFLVCIAYIDPGNVITDLQAGHDDRYSLLWVMLVSTLGGLFIQCLSAKLGLVARRHLAEQCRVEYQGWVKWLLWVAAEIAVIGADVPEVVGSAYAIYFITFRHIPVWAGVLFVGLNVLEFPLLQWLGTGRVEAVVSAMVSVISACYIVELFIAKPDWGAAGIGLILPLIKNGQAMLDATGLIGAVVMPHNLFLHSCIVQEKELDDDTVGTRIIAAKYNYIESTFALFVSLLINIALIMIAAKKFQSADPTMGTAVTIFDSINKQAGQVLFSIGLFCAGQSATITGTFAHQIVIKGFTGKELPLYQANILLRLITAPPCLIVAIVFKSVSDAHKLDVYMSALIFWSQVVLSFALPFAMVPLIRFTNNPVLMGRRAVNGPITKVTAYSCTFIVLAANVFTTVFSVIQQVEGSSLVVQIIMYGASGILSIMYCAVALWLLFRPMHMGEEEEEDTMKKINNSSDYW